MKISYIIDKASSFNQSDYSVFLDLLKEQNQVENPSITRIKSCYFLCFAYVDDIPIGIGALKNVYKSPFDYAKINTDVKDVFNYELGYIYVKNDKKYRGLGIGKTISKLLVNMVDDNIFATTENIKTNNMLYILNSIGFNQYGSPYLGKKTGKNLILLLKFKQ